MALLYLPVRRLCTGPQSLFERALAIYEKAAHGPDPLLIAHHPHPTGGRLPLPGRPLRTGRTPYFPPAALETYERTLETRSYPQSPSAPTTSAPPLPSPMGRYEGSRKRSTSAPWRSNETRARQKNTPKNRNRPPRPWPNYSAGDKPSAHPRGADSPSSSAPSASTQLFYGPTHTQTTRTYPPSYFRLSNHDHPARIRNSLGISKTRNDSWKSEFDANPALDR